MYRLFLESWRSNNDFQVFISSTINNRLYRTGISVSNDDRLICVWQWIIFFCHILASILSSYSDFDISIIEHWTLLFIKSSIATCQAGGLLSSEGMLRYDYLKNYLKRREIISTFLTFCHSNSIVPGGFEVIS